MYLLTNDVAKHDPAIRGVDSCRFWGTPAVATRIRGLMAREPAFSHSFLRNVFLGKGKEKDA
jgi:hypothetical protein